MRMPARKQTTALISSGIFIALLLLPPEPALSQNDMVDVAIEAKKVGQGIYMLTGRGGNLGLSVGVDGAFLIDDQFAPLTEKITAAVASVSDRPIASSGSVAIVVRSVRIRVPNHLYRPPREAKPRAESALR